MALLVLSYDTTEEYYQEGDFKEELAEFLLSNGATDLHSYVASTISFETNITDPVSTWNKLIKAEYEVDFYYYLCRVFETNTGARVFRKKAKPNLDEEFQKIVEKVQRKLARAKRK